MPVRQKIANSDAVTIDNDRPMAGIAGLSGIRVHDVGQGDAITVLGDQGQPALQFDYGGRQGRGFARGIAAAKRIPVDPERLLMLSHWDEDHWCTAQDTPGATAAHWLVPRQQTSPRAAAFSAGFDRIRCIPERMAGQSFAFPCTNGDAVMWEKIAPGPPVGAGKEDCNLTGVALSVVKGQGSNSRVILLPGDAPFDKVAHYRTWFDQGAELVALVAYHHGSRKHWNDDIRNFLSEWAMRSRRPRFLFSCSSDNSYGHPHLGLYEGLASHAVIETTYGMRAAGKTSVDILF